MIIRRSAHERGHANHGWLDSWHTFSFANYYDQKHMGFRSLRVINDDRIAGGGGFGTHPHENMEIITYVLDGALQHRDSLGTGSIIKPNDAQRMTAGTGIAHSEYNASKTEMVRLLQIWIEPAQQGLNPSYEQKAFPIANEPGQFHLLASPDARNGSITINQDVLLHAGRLHRGDSVDYPLASSRHAWVQVARGDITVNDVAAREGDGLQISSEARLAITATTDAEVLLFDLA